MYGDENSVLCEVKFCRIAFKCSVFESAELFRIVVSDTNLKLIQFLVPLVDSVYMAPLIWDSLVLDFVAVCSLLFKVVFKRGRKEQSRLQVFDSEDRGGCQLLDFTGEELYLDQCCRFSFLLCAVKIFFLLDSLERNVDRATVFRAQRFFI